MTAPDAALARWIRNQLAAEAPRVPSLVVTVWGDALAPRGGEFWLSTILRLLAALRVNERAVRTGVLRLHRGGWLQPRAVGRRSRYRLTPGGAEDFERAFHRVYDPPFRRWQRAWEGVLAGNEVGGPALRKRLRDELAWAGYGRFGAGIFLRPARGDDAAARIARTLGVAAAMTAFSARDPGDAGLPALTDRAPDVWRLETLAGEYRRFIARFGGVSRALRGRAIGDEQAFVVRTLLVHAYRRVRLRDPQLPRDVLPPDWPGAQAYSVAGTLYRACAPGADRFVHRVLDAEREGPAPGRVRTGRRFAEPA